MFAYPSSYLTRGLLRYERRGVVNFEDHIYLRGIYLDELLTVLSSYGLRSLFWLRGQNCFLFFFKTTEPDNVSGPCSFLSPAHF